MTAAYAGVSKMFASGRFDDGRKPAELYKNLAFQGCGNVFGS
jgi:hypothetical protein